MMGPFVKTLRFGNFTAYHVYNGTFYYYWLAQSYRPGEPRDRVAYRVDKWVVTRNATDPREGQG